MSAVQRKAHRIMLAALAVATLAGCAAANPINWYRDLTGASKNDDTESSRNKGNLEAGGDQPYPTIGSVPPPPETALSTVDRKALEKGLVADRANARYSDDELRQGRSVPPLPGEPPAPAPDAAPPSDAAPHADTAPSTAAPADAAPTAAAAGARHNPPVRGSESAPQESSLTSPSVRSLPQGETPHQPPPAPPGVASKQAQSAPKAAAPAAAPPAASPPEQASSRQLAMAPSRAQPDLRALPPAVMLSKGASVTMAAAEIGFAADGALSADDRKRLADVAGMLKDGGGKVRIIGYGREGRGPDAVQQELASFDMALDRANAAAQALAKLGVPASRITVQVAPELRDGGLEAGRAEVLLEY